ncbi:MFS transporter [Hortaea werneckii]|nr:MFS transporter [Hortaea werneckii]
MFDTYHSQPSAKPLRTAISSYPSASHHLLWLCLRLTGILESLEAFLAKTPLAAPLHPGSSLRPRGRICSRLDRRGRRRTAPRHSFLTLRLLHFPLARKRLGERTTVAEPESPLVENVHGDGDETADAAEDEGRGRELELGSRLDVGVEGADVEGRDAGKEVATEAVAACGRGRVGPVRRDHVVDGGHVDGEVRDADGAETDERRDPVDAVGWTERGRAEAEETDRQERREEDDEIADQQRDEAEADGDRLKAPLLHHHPERIQAEEDERIAEATEEGQKGDDRFEDQEAIRAPHQHADFFPAEPAPEVAPDLVRPVDIACWVNLAEPLGFLVENASRASFRGEGMEELSDAAEHEADPISTYSWMKPPKIGAMTDPVTEENTTYATAYCWYAGSHRSATIPSVTEPPADDRPPRNRKTNKTQYSSEKGAQSSQPKA